MRLIYIYIYIYLETGKKTLKLGALPTVNLPQRSCESTLKSPERRHINIVQERSTDDKTVVVYKHFADFVKKVNKMKHKWEIKVTDTTVTLKHFLKPYIVPEYEVIVDDSLAFTCVVFGWIVPDDNEIYKIYKRLIRKIGLAKLLTH